MSLNFDFIKLEGQDKEVVIFALGLFMGASPFAQGTQGEFKVNRSELRECRNVIAQDLPEHLRLEFFAAINELLKSTSDKPINLDAN